MAPAPLSITLASVAAPGACPGGAAKDQRCARTIAQLLGSGDAPR